tara:strand:- start:911 stop:1375 length:465 start_codon:yes stop_codon:yes gene_type:complete
MGLFFKSSIEELRILKKDLKDILDFRRDLNTLLKKTTEFKGPSGQRVLLREFLKLNSFLEETKKDERRVMRDLVKDLKNYKLNESDLRSFSRYFKRFLDSAQGIRNYKSLKRDPHKFNFLSQMVAIANKLIAQIDVIIREEIAAEKRKKEGKVA